MTRAAFLVLAVFWGLIAAEPTVPTASPKAAASNRVALLQIDGPIDDGKAQYLHRALTEAKAAGVTRIVTRLTTDGGHLGAGLDILESLLALRRDSGDTITCTALVEGKAWSAGAMIAYGHQEIYLTPASHIGDIGIITIKEGEIVYLPEKIESPVRAHLRTAAQANGWNEAKLVKMTARNQALYRVTVAGVQHHVIQDDLARFRADHAGVPDTDVVQILGEDRLISYTAVEAVDATMATGVVDSLDALWTKLGIDPATVIDLSPTPMESLSWTLAGFAPLLAALAALCIFLEFKVPSGGLWLIGAAALGLGFFVCQYYLALANYLELILILIGLVLVVLELTALHSGGVLGASGGLLALVGLILAFMPDRLQFESVGGGEWILALGHALKQSLLALVAITVGLLWMIRALPGSRAVARIAAQGEITATSAGAQELHAGIIIGRQAVAANDLHPSGTITLDGEPLSAIAEHGAGISAGTTVVIIGMRFGEAMVRPIAAGSAA